MSFSRITFAGLIAIALVIAGGSMLLLTEQPVVADGMGEGCDSPLVNCSKSLTRGVWGKGPTCAAALLDFNQQADALIVSLQADCCADHCGTCGTPTRTTDPCIVANGQQQVDGTVTVRCLAEPFRDPGPM